MTEIEEAAVEWAAARRPFIDATLHGVGEITPLVNRLAAAECALRDAVIDVPQ